MDMATFVNITGVWAAAGIIICMLTYPFKETVLYRFAEHSMVGIMAGHLGVLTVTNLQSKTFAPVFKGDLTNVIPIFLGLVLYLRLAKPSLGWTARFPLIVMLGAGLGLSFRTILTTDFIQQLQPAIVPLGSDMLSNFNIILGVVIVFCGLFYFVFTRQRPTKIERSISLLGQYFVMVALGTVFGNYIVTRFNVLAKVFFFLLSDWLHLI